MARFNRSIIENVDNQNSGSTNLDVHTFIDEYGNVTQIGKKSKNRLKYYIDPKIEEQEFCVIGISGESDSSCIEGIGLGLGDNNFGLAKYTLD